MNLIRPLINETGGLVYHWRALQHRHALWHPFQDWVAKFLSQWLEDPTHLSLIVVGPSSGYTLPLEWLKRFKSLIFVEPDPVARWILKSRLGMDSSKIEFRSTTWSTDPHGLHSLAQEFPQAPFLFSNILGQLHLVHTDVELIKLRTAMQALADGRPLASYHDRLSGNLAPDGAVLAKLDQFYTNSELVQMAYPKVHEELTDHDTMNWFDQSLARRYGVWELLPKQFHLIEGVYKRP